MAHVQSCLNAKVIRNRYTGDLFTCRCGKCDVCLNTRASQWVQRLDMESSCHKYTLFCTLTYDDLHVPQVVRLSPEYSQDKIADYYDSESDEIFSLSDCKATFTERDKRYIEANPVLNVLSKRDFQLFIKRLRYYFNQTDKGALLRYYIVGELGPSTYRPHGHMLLFFDSKKCADRISELLSLAWSDKQRESFGICFDPHFVQGSAAQYCASYINSVTELPRVYLHKGLRPFSLFSKCPAIGSLHSSSKEVREIFDRGDTSFRIFSKGSNEFKDVSFWRSFVDRLFPRCQRFSQLLLSDRIALYRFIEQFEPCLTARQIANRIKREYIDSNRSDFFGRYFQTIAFKTVSCKHIVGLQSAVDWRLKDLPFLPDWSKYIERPFIGVDSFRREYMENSLVRFVNTLRRVQHQAQIFNVSIDYYVKKISDYFDKVSYQKLVDDYKFQDDYFHNHPKWHIIYFDKSFYYKVTTLDYGTWSDSTKKYINFLFDNHPQFTYKSILGKHFNEVLDIPSLESLSDFQDMAFLHRKISHDLKKQKKNNDYVMLHADKYKSQLIYQL